MKKMIGKIFSLTLAVSLLTSCSMGNTASEIPEASGGAISGGVTSSLDVSAVQGTKAEIRTTQQVGSKYANDDNKYVMERWGEALFQGKLDTEPDQYDKTIDMEISSLEWVTNEWIYYTVYVNNTYTEEEELWRMPIEKTKRGDKVKKDKKEKLFRKYDITVTYATDSYLIIENRDEERRASLWKYDLDTRKLEELIGYKELGDHCNVLDDRTVNQNPHVVNGNLIIEGEKKLYRVDPETGDSAVLLWYYGSWDSAGVDDWAQSGSILYFLMGNTLYQYDGIDRRVSSLVQIKTLKETLDNLEQGKIWKIHVNVLYVDSGRVYLVIKTKRMGQKREDDPYKKKYYKKLELFSAPEDNLGQLRREEILMDYLDKKGVYEEGEKDYDDDDPTEDDYCIYDHTESIENIFDGMVYARYETKNGKDHYVKYDTQTQKIKKISWDVFFAEERTNGRTIQ